MNNINVKQTVLWIFTGAIIVGGLSYFGLSPRFAGDADKPQNKNLKYSENGKERYLLKLDFGNGKIRKFSGDMGGETAKAWDLLQIASAQSSVEVEIEGKFIPRSIDGVKNSEQGKWVLYVNGVKQNSGPFEVIVERGDTVEFKYEK